MSDLPVIDLGAETAAQSSYSPATVNVGGVTQPAPRPSADPAPDTAPALEPAPAPAPDTAPTPESVPALDNAPEVEKLDPLPNPDVEADFTKAVNDALAALDDPGAATDPNQSAEPAKPEGDTDGTGGDAEGGNDPTNQPDKPKDNSDPTADLKLDEFDDVNTDDWKANASRSFERIKGQRKELMGEVDTLKAKVAQYETQMAELKGSMNSETIEELQAKIAQFEHQQTFHDLESTAAYRDTITQPLVDRIKVLDQIAVEAGVDADALIDLVSDSTPEPDNPPEFDEAGNPYLSKDARIEAMLQNTGPRNRAAVFTIANEMADLMRLRAEMFQNADQAYKEAQLLEQQQAEAAAAENAKTRANITNAVVEQVFNRVPFLNDMEGVDPAKLREEVSAVDVSGLHAVDAQYYAVTAKLFPAVVQDLHRAQAENEALMAKLAQFEEAVPPAGGGATPPATRPPGGVAYRDDTKADFASVVNQEMAARGLGLG